ncbi:MAG: HAMP domain-containing sensor histidine kinase [Proteobacteria bacterium]|nr:HAMP domain-containing sensor histidine kinase [Pseudomonadota bacterium]
MANERDISVPIERKQTDKSLQAERAKTDVALAEGKEKAKNRADDTVSASRATADEAKSLARDEIDSIASEIASSSAGAVTEKLLIKDRSAADDALETERRQMDSALEIERNEKRAVERHLFTGEREETDRHLTSERQEIDMKVRNAAEGLAEEKDAHLATKAALTTRDEFLAIVSHDLRNPLGAISMVAKLLTSSSTYTAVDDETREYIDMIGRNAGEALRLIGDLLDMERIASGKLGLQFEIHDLGQIIAHAVETFKLQASAKGLALEAPTKGTAILVKCDRVRMSQVLSNLLSNAIKFTPSGGRVAVDFRLVHGDVQISVSDSGPGMPTAMLETIFKRFWQIGKHDRRGLGLGLYISKMLVEAHQGHIWVESEVGKGSVFHVSLPKA